jgi:large subunit ribosomal protein L30
MAKRSSEKKIRITLVRSPIGYSERQKNTVRALGLRRINQTVEQVDTPVVRGMIAKVRHLVQVKESMGDEAS